MSAQRSLEAARALPPRLLRFFQRYPPPALFPPPAPAAATAAVPSASASAAAAAPAAFATPDTPSTAQLGGAHAAAAGSSPPDRVLAVPSHAPARVPAHAHDLPYPNPFLPTKNFATGRWHGPAFGLRKQADLVKLAARYGVVDLLPWTIKKPGEREARRADRGLQVKGTGAGQRVKGKLWERTLKGRLEMRRQAMLNMPALIQDWKQKGHGRGWKKWPSGKAKK